MDLDELAKQQGVEPVTDLATLVVPELSDLWSDDAHTSEEAYMLTDKEREVLQLIWHNPSIKFIPDQKAARAARELERKHLVEYGWRITPLGHEYVISELSS